jgi:hypothetical protein
MAYRDNHGTTAHPTAARTPFAAGDTFLTGTPPSRTTVYTITVIMVYVPDRAADPLLDYR